MWLRVVSPGLALALALVVAPAGASGADAQSSASLGQALVHTAMNPPFWSPRAYENAWKRWGLPEKPVDYARTFRDRYGLHPAPYPNNGLPMGFHRTRGLLGVGQGIGNDCLICHSGTVAGRTIVGLGNASLDLQSLYEDLAAADGADPSTPLPVSQVRGTNEASNFAVYLMQFRDPELRQRPPTRLPIRSNLCEDVPAWWLGRKKKTLYHLGVADSRSVRTMMPFLLIPFNGADAIKKREPDFAAIRDYLRSIEPPRYPFPVDSAKVARGRVVFEKTCARCHGSYGPDGHYPNKVVPLDVIGTDPTLARSFDPGAVAHYLGSWFARERGPAGEAYHGLNGGGYQAPPLDGLWATAPYFHNGSSPTVYHVLNSKSRPTVFTRSFRGDLDEYDTERLGVKVTVREGLVDPSLPAMERRKVYDTRLPGRGNAGHTFGDDLDDGERAGVIEYLKTL